MGRISKAKLTISRSLLLDIHQEMVLSKLRIVKSAAFDHFDRNSEPECHPETRVALLRDMMRWVWDPEGDSIFWLQGMAGTGKSTLSRTFARKLQKKGLLGASFFFKRGDGERGMARMFFPTIASQLAMQLPSLAQSLKSALEREGDVGEKSMKVQFEKLILQPLQGIPTGRSKLTTLIIIIDALDECDPEPEATTIIRLLPLLKLLPSVRLKFFVTSRPEFPILLEFDKIKGAYEGLVLHHVEKDIMTHDLKVYFEFELGKIREDYNRLQPPDDQLSPDWPGQDRISVLVKLSVPLFIFAKTVCLFIADYAYSDPEEQLQRVMEVQKVDYASQLHRTYLFVLNRLLLQRSDSGLVECDAEEKEKILDNFRKIVGSLVLLDYPLSIDSLSRLLQIPKRNIRNMLNLLHSVLDVPGLDKPTAPVKTLHLSFRDFLTDPKNQTKNPFWIDEVNVHAALTTGCMNVLLEDGVIYEGMYKGVWRWGYNPGEDSLAPDKLDLEIETYYTKLPIGSEIREELRFYQEMVEARLPPHVQYACLRWLYHISRSGPNIYDVPQVNTMLERKGQSWLDALTCMGEVTSEGAVLSNHWARLDEELDNLAMSQQDGVKV